MKIRNLFCTAAALAAFFASALIAAEITLAQPAADAVVTHLRPDWRQILDERLPHDAKNNADYLTPTGMPDPVVFAWSGAGNGPYTLEISRTRDFSDGVRTITVNKPEAKVYNLEIAREYFWRVKSKDAVSGVRRFTTADTAGIRQIMVSPTGPANVRDWGGKHIRGGGRTKQGVAYRGTQMQKPFALTDAAKKVMLDELKIRTDLDLRYDKQISGMDSSPLGPSVQWRHYAINAYNSFKPENRAEQFPLWRDAVRIFADEKNLPVYFHCYGGVDRTGELAMLLDFLLDVDEEETMLDYEFSTMANFNRARTIGYLNEWIFGVASFTPDRKASRRVQAENFLLAIGVTREEITAIRRNLTE